MAPARNTRRTTVTASAITIKAELAGQLLPQLIPKKKRKRKNQSVVHPLWLEMPRKRWRPLPISRPTITGLSWRLFEMRREGASPKRRWCMRANSGHGSKGLTGPRPRMWVVRWWVGTTWLSSEACHCSRHALTRSLEKGMIFWPAPLPSTMHSPVEHRGLHRLIIFD